MGGLFYYMPTIKEISERVSKAHANLPNAIENIVYDLVDDILYMNTEGQMFQGFNNFGGGVGVYASNYKGNGKGYPKIFNEPYNLFIDGKLFKSVDYIFKKSNMQITMFSDNPEHPFLKYNPIIAKDLFGLTEPNQHKLNYELIKPLLVQWIKKSI